MTTPTDVPATSSTTAGEAASGTRRPAGPVRALAAAVAASWLLPLLTHAAGLDIVLVPVLVLATAAQLTIGSTLIDRLIPAVGLVCGIAIAGGFLFSVWPFGLQPVPVAGLWLTAASALAFWTYARTGRRPSLPRRAVGSDLPLLAAGGYAAWVALAPSLRAAPAAKLGYTTLTGDRMRQFGLFDAIHRAGGYPFLRWHAAAPIVDPKIGRVYPAGMHYLYALLDTFAVSGTHPGNPVAELNRYRYYVALGFAFLVLSIAWAARRVLGAATPGWQRALVVSAVGAWAATGVFTTMLWCTWDAEVLALAFIALAGAVAVRPMARPAEQLILVGALVAAAGFTYSLYVPFAWALAGVFWLANRRRLRRHLPLTVIVGAVSLLISVLPYLLQLRYDTVSTSDGLLTPGFAITVPHSTLLLLALLCVLGTLSATGRRRPTTATLAVLLGTALAIVSAFGLYQLAKIGYTTYYFPKAMHIVLVFGLMGAGTAVTVLKPGTRATATPGRRRAAGVAGALAGVIAVGAAVTGPVRFRYQDMYPGPDTTWARVWADGGQIFGVHGAALAYLSDRHLLGDGKPTLALWDRAGTENRDLTLIMAALNHDSGTMGAAVYGLTDINGLTGVAAPATPGAPLDPASQGALSAVTKLISASPVPLRVITPDPVVAAWLRGFASSHPWLKLTVLHLPALPGERSPS